VKKLWKVLGVCIIALVGLTFTGCAIAGSQGPRGPSGQDGDRVVTNLNDHLLWLWDNVTTPSGTTEGRYFNGNYYADFPTFAVLYPQRYLQGPPGGQGLPGTGNPIHTANLVVQSAVDIRANRSIQGTTFLQAGGGVIFRLPLAGNASSNTYSGDMYIITNYHVVSRLFGQNLLIANDITISLFGLSHIRIPAVMIGGSIEHDVAILRVNGNSVVAGVSVAYMVNNFPVREAQIPEQWENATRLWTPSMGTPIMAVGNPLGNGMSVTSGEISISYETITLPRLDDARVNQPNRVMRISPAINPGNSGGGIFNQNAELVGIVMARMYWSGPGRDTPIAGVAYAIPLDIALRIAEQIYLRSDEFDGESMAIQRFNHGLNMQVTNTITVFDTCTCPDPNLCNAFYTQQIKIIETVQLTTARPGTSLGAGTTIVSITVGARTYPITRMHQIHDLMIEAWQSNAIVKVNNVQLP